MINKKTIDNTLIKINNQYNYLVNNPYSTFYKDKYKKANIKFKSIKSFKQFEKLPYLTKEELLNVGPYNFTFLPKKSINHVCITSGTSNQDKPLLLLMDVKARPAQNVNRFQPFFDSKIKASLILLSNITTMHRYQTNYGAIENGVINIMGDLTNLPLTAKTASRMQIEAIETTSSILYLFIPFLKKEYDLNKIKILMLSGEYTSEQKYKLLQKSFKNARIIFGFGGIETGGIGKKCIYLEKMAPRFFHPWDNLYLEVLNKETEGELVVTGIEKGIWPNLIRYRTGNHIKLTTIDCPCGETKLIELFGKIGHDVLKVQGTFIYSSHIHQILAKYLKLLQTSDFRLHVYEVIKKDKIMTRLVLQVILKEGLKDLEKTKKEISYEVSNKLFLTSKNTLSDLVNKKIFMPLEIEFVKSLPFNFKQTSIVSHII